MGLSFSTSGAYGPLAYDFGLVRIWLTFSDGRSSSAMGFRESVFLICAHVRNSPKSFQDRSVRHRTSVWDGNMHRSLTEAYGFARVPKPKDHRHEEQPLCTFDPG